MGKIATIRIVGKEYPMSFSLMAAKKITEKFGSMEKAFQKMAQGTAENSSDTLMDTLVYMVEILISQGCAYKNMFEKDVPPPENAPVIEGKWTPLPREALEIALGISDIEEINAKIQECINGGKEKEVESVEKNLQATQG